jgi:hypothetical protein
MEQAGKEGQQGEVAEIVKVKLREDVEVIINDLEAAKRILQTRDEYVKGMSRFDLQSKTLTNTSERLVTPEELMAFQASCVRPFPDEDVKKLQLALESLSAKLAKLTALPIPPVIYLTMTNGREEGREAYCRGNGIFLPVYSLIWTPSKEGEMSVEELLTHELWHIISRNLSKEVRDSVYACIGFSPFPTAFEYPPQLFPRKISNPDGPKFEHYVSFPTDQGEMMYLVPIIFSRHESYSREIAQSFFEYLEVRLLQVQPVPQEAGTTTSATASTSSGEVGQAVRWVPVEADPLPDDAATQEKEAYRVHAGLKMFDLNSLPMQFWMTVGMNTLYMYHPDETTADNFVLLVQGDRHGKMRTPAIVARLAALFTNE